MSKEQVIDYVMTTPGNPNRAVLSGMLDSLAGGGGTSDISVAEITLTTENIVPRSQEYASIATIDPNNSNSIGETRLVTGNGDYSPDPQTVVFNAILYKGKLTFEVPNPAKNPYKIVSGAVVPIEEDGTVVGYEVTGDCTMSVLKFVAG